MSKKKNNKIIENRLGLDYLKDIDDDSDYSLSVDPHNVYDLSDEHKQFIKLYLQYNSLSKVCSLLDIEPHVAKDYLLRYSTQSELRRLNLAIHHRKVATRIISYEDLGSYLSSWLIGDNITEDDKLKGPEKLRLVKLLLDWHKGMQEIRDRPAVVLDVSVEEELDQLKAVDIKELLQRKKLLSSIKKAEESLKGSGDINNKIKTQKPSSVSKETLLQQIFSVGQFSEAEKTFIETLSLEELKELVE